jgi:hypothetical protein
MMNSPSPGLPDGSNVAGCIWSNDLGRVHSRALATGPWTTRRIDRSAFDRHWRLRIEVPDVLDLESDGPLDDGSYLFNGAIEPTDRGLHCLRTVSKALGVVGIPHVLEFYRDDAHPAVRLHFGWPEIYAQKPDVPLWR